MKKLIFLSGIVLFLLQSCTSDKRSLPQPTVNCDYTQESLKYNGLIKTIIDKKCISCHTVGGPGPDDFTTYAGIKPKIDNGTFRQRVIVLHDMPLGDTLSLCDFNALHDWLNANAPE